MTNKHNGIAAPIPDPNETEKFLELLGIGKGAVDFRAFSDDRETKRMPSKKITSTFADCQKTLETLNQTGAGIFLIINQTDGKGQKSENIVRVRALFADLDGVPKENIARFPLVPTVIVETSPGKFHAYWVCSGIPLERFKPLQRALAALIGSDASVCDLPRCMRLPGYLHQKDPSAPHLVQIIASDRNANYSSDEIEAMLGSSPPQKPVKRSPATLATARYSLNTGYPDGQRTGALTHLAGVLIRQGLSDDDALEKLTIWNRLNHPPLPEPKIFKTFYNIRQADDRKLTDLQMKLRQFDDRFRLIIPGNMSAIVDEETSKHLKPQAFHDLMSHVTDGDRPVSRTWLKTTHHRYPDVTFDPASEPGGNSKGPDNTEPYNLWRGLAVSPAPGCVELYEKHVLEVICDGDIELFEYVMSWIAHLFQKPTELPEVALVLKGAHGVGKGRFIKPLEVILGTHFIECAQLDQALGRFNGHLADKLLMHANEATWGGNKQQEGALKAMITERQLAYESKYQGIQTLRNYRRVIISSNNNWVVPAAMTERRFVVLTPNDAHRGDLPYFNSLTQELENGGYPALLKYFLERDIAGFDPRNRPVTKGLTNQKIASLCPVGSWLFDALSNGEFSADQNNFPVPYEDFIPTSELWASYDKYAEKDRFRRHHVTTSKQLVIQIKEYLPVTNKRRTVDQGHAGVNELRGLVFPPLEEARDAFEAKLESPIDWDDALEVEPDGYSDPDEKLEGDYAEPSGDADEID